MSSSRLQKTIESITETIARFPLPMLDVMVIVAATMIWVEDYRWYVIPSLGFPLLIASTLFSERFEVSAVARFLIALIPVPLLILYAAVLPGDHLSFVEGLRLALFFIAAVLAMLAFPFIAPRTTASFHRFATDFILRLLLTALFTLLLWGGLALALLAIDKLFSVEIAGQAYTKLLVFIIGFVAVPFLLSSVERDLNVQTSDIPKVLRILTMYVLMPILVVYALILYAHAAQQILNWEWSEGWVARLVAGYAGAGLLTFAILWPQRNDPDNQWVRSFTRWFSILLSPLALLLFLAVMRRVNEYGVTESRYYGLVIAVWLAGVAFYLLFSQKADIRILALSLAVLALATSFGPWGASAVSVRSQVGQLQSALDSVGVLKNGKFVSPPVPFDEAAIGHRSIFSIVYFLRERDGLEYLRPWFGKAPDTIGEREVMVAIGNWSDSPEKNSEQSRPVRIVEIYGPERETARVSGYDYYTPVTQSSASIPISGDSLSIGMNGGKLHLFLRGRPVLTANLLEKFRQLYRERTKEGDRASEITNYESISIPPDKEAEMVMDVEDPASGYRMRVSVRQVSLYAPESSTTLQNLSGYVLVGRR